MMAFLIFYGVMVICFMACGLTQMGPGRESSAVLGALIWPLTMVFSGCVAFYELLENGSGTGGPDDPTGTT